MHSDVNVVYIPKFNIPIIEDCPHIHMRTLLKLDVVI